MPQLTENVGTKEALGSMGVNLWFDCWHQGPIKRIPTRGAAYLIGSRGNELLEITPAYRTVIQAIIHKEDPERGNGTIKRKRALCLTVEKAVLRI